MPRLADPDDRSTARGVCLVACGIVLGIVASFLNHSLRPHGLRAASSAVLAAELAVAFAALALNRSGSPRAAARLLAASLALFAAGLMTTSGQGFRDVSVLILPQALILCGLLLDRATLVGVTLLTIACAAAVLVAESRGLVPASEPIDPAADVPDAAIILGVAGLGVALVAGRLRESHARLRRSESELRASESRYRWLVDLAADPIVLSTAQAEIVEANDRAIELTGRTRDELLATRLDALFGEDELLRAPLRYDLADQGRIVIVERRLTRKDGARVPVEMSSRRMPDGRYQTILRDVSERQRAEAERAVLEARLQQSQKLEAVGRLAGGVAHDFNNLLTAITGSLTLALRDVAPEARAHRWLRETDKAAWRAASLTHQLLAFSRRQVIEPRVVDLRALVAGAGSMLSRIIGEDIALDTRTDDAPCLVEVDPGQLEPVLLNLGANARDAMPDGGTLTIAVSRASRAPASAGRTPEGPVALLTVSDTGHGMSDDVRARIFEPFFTTRAPGAGTGLGLAMAYGAVGQNGGSIEVVSRPGEGASFRIVLPLARGESAEAKAGEAEPPRGSGKVLLVEDEAAVRDVARAQLESLGYSVLACANGAEALLVTGALSEPLDLLLTDVVMPGMNGRELAARLRERQPGLRVLFTSGYGEEVLARHGEPGMLLLQKPFALARLASLVREALQADPFATAAAR